MKKSKLTTLATALLGVGITFANPVFAHDNDRYRDHDRRDYREAKHEYKHHRDHRHYDKWENHRHARHHRHDDHCEHVVRERIVYRERDDHRDHRDTTYRDDKDWHVRVILDKSWFRM